MYRHLFLLVLLSLLQPASVAQHGQRADSIQNYVRSLRPPNPELVLNVKTVHKKIYLHATDLRKMKRMTVTATDPVTNTTSTYEGVSLQELAPLASTGPTVETLELSFGFYHKRIIQTADLDTESRTMVTDTINGERLTGYTPFCFVATTKQGETVLVRKVTSIKFKADSTTRR